MVALSRRGAISAAMLASAGVVMPPTPPASGVVLPGMVDGRDAELVRSCAAFIQAREAFEGGDLDSDESPHWSLAVVLWHRIGELPAHTLEGVVAVATVAKYLAQQPGGEDFDNPVVGFWPGRVVNDLLRLHAA